jgi:hypothetical protein
MLNLAFVTFGPIILGVLSFFGGLQYTIPSVEFYLHFLPHPQVSLLNIYFLITTLRSSFERLSNATFRSPWTHTQGLSEPYS